MSFVQVCPPFVESCHWTFVGFPVAVALIVPDCVLARLRLPGSRLMVGASYVEMPAKVDVAVPAAFVKTAR